MKNFKVLTFVVRIEKPPGMTILRMRDYIRAAVRYYHEKRESRHEKDWQLSLCELEVNRVIDKHEIFQCPSCGHSRVPGRKFRILKKGQEG